MCRDLYASIYGVRCLKRYLRGPVSSWFSSKPFTGSDLAPRSSGKENHLKNVKPFIETLRVTNPVRQSWASSREASLA